MSRLSLLAWSLAFLTLGAGAIGYAATGERTSHEAEPTPSGKFPSAAREPVQHVGSPDAIAIVQPGDQLTATLLAAGTGGLDAALAEVAAGDARPVIGRPLRLWFGPALGSGARTLERLEFRLPLGRSVIITRAGEDFVRKEISEVVDDTLVRIRLSGEPDLDASLVKAGLPPGLRASLLHKVARQPVSALDLIVAHEQAGPVGEYGAVLYLALHFRSGDVRRWLNLKGSLRPIASSEVTSGLSEPVSGRITSQPGIRFHPILRYLRWHRGTDFAASAGTPVRAALSGRVIQTGWQGGYGRVVRLAHEDGSQTLYAHLGTVGTEEGAVVAEGAIIGAVGASGLATGPHLHFEWLRGREILRPAFRGQGEDGVTALEPQQFASLQALLAAPYRLPPPTGS